MIVGARNSHKGRTDPPGSGHVVVKAIVTDHSADLAELKRIVAGHMETMTALQLASHSH